MKETQSLIARAEEAIASAELMHENGFYDAAVSRSYYAMLYSAQAVLMTRKLKFSSHKSVISLFGRHFVKTGLFPSESGRLLNRALELRMLGDYSFVPSSSENTSREVLGWAKDFLAEVEKYFSSRIVEEDD